MRQDVILQLIDAEVIRQRQRRNESTRHLCPGCREMQRDYADLRLAELAEARAAVVSGLVCEHGRVTP